MIEQSARACGHGVEFALGVRLGDDFRLDAEEGTRGRARLGGHSAGDGRNHDGAGLGLPPRVDDGAAVVADLLAIPHPRLGVDRLPYSSK